MPPLPSPFTHPSPVASSGPDTKSPALGSFAVTPSDSADLTARIRQITIGTAAGTVAYIAWDGSSNDTGPLPVGSYPMFATRILSTGTTATGLTGWV